MTESSIPASDAVVAAVNDERGLVTLYDADGVPIQVGPRQVDYWLARGFRRTVYDRKAAFKEAKVVGQALVAALKVADEDDESLEAARAAVDAFGDAFAQFYNGATATAPAIDTAPVLFKRAGSAETEAVDPGQVELYRSKEEYQEVRRG